MKRFAYVVALLAALSSGVTVVQAGSAVSLSGTKCVKAGSIRSVKGTTFTCLRLGKTLKWKPVSTSSGKTTVSTVVTSSTVPVSPSTTTTTVATAPCRTTAQIYSRLPNELQKREWESVVARLQPIAASADSSGKTTAVIDTVEDVSVGNLEYGRYYPMSYPSVVEETQQRGCAYLALVLDVFVRFTGSDTSDVAARNGILAVTKALLQEFLAKHTTVDGYKVDVLLIEPVLDHCPGRKITGSRTICPWNDVGFLYFRTASLNAAQVAATPASDIFSLGVPGAMFPPRPFTQIVGIGSSSTPVVSGTVRDLVPAANKSHQASSYVEFSDQTSELGQSLSVDSSIPVSSLTVRTIGHIATVDGRRVSGSGAAVPATIQTRIYKFNESGDIPTSVRRSSFSKVVDVAQNVSFPHFSSVTIALPSGTVLAPGKYLITFTISGWNPSGSYIRLESFAEGPLRQTDAYSGGRAYRSCNLRSQIGYRLTDNPAVTFLGSESPGANCENFYAEVSKGENPARGMQHTWVWSDLAMTLNAP